MPKVWDNHEIKAELARRGYTLTGLAIDNGLFESACRRALTGSCKAGALVIAKTLGVSVQELWPGRYIQRPRNGATARASKASPKCGSSADTPAVA
ncbi:MAG: helix-turn-helix domain-containing protein [Hyphomicrobiaceae bacterium]|nr:helix-turn-helix domain-containing protein [Hyphomicrobiaceae bacterium]